MNTQPLMASTDFERFALDHAAHNHCDGCGGCLLDSSPLVQDYRSWCIGCRDRIKLNSARTGVPLPWTGGWEFADENQSTKDKK